jgi:hypothetical protein
MDGNVEFNPEHLTTETHSKQASAITGTELWMESIQFYAILIRIKITYKVHHTKQTIIAQRQNLQN